MAKLIDVGSIGSYFESLSDPRHTRSRKHLLVDIAVIAVCGIICGCDGPTAIHCWAKHRASWLAQHLDLSHGIPSRDCIRRLLVALKPEAFQRCFQSWIRDGIPTDAHASGRLVAIDGKSCRGSHDKAHRLGVLHIVSAWASEEGIALGEVATEAKSKYRYHETREEGHSRIDERSYYLARTPRDFAPGKDWPWIKAIGYSVRITQHADGTESDEVRYYLSSRFLSGKRFGEAVRGHWGFESMYWVLDVNFREDENRTRERNLGNNLSWLRRFAVTLLKRHPDKDSLRGKMIACMINTDLLTQVLSLQRV